LVTFVFRGKRIRVQAGVKRRPIDGTTTPAPQQNLALAVASLLAPCALITFTLTFWNIAAALHWTVDFFVARGVFAHWQSWLIASSVLLLVSRVLSQCVDENDSEY
jgi:hypothetical protein